MKNYKAKFWVEPERTAVYWEAEFDGYSASDEDARKKIFDVLVAGDERHQADGSPGRTPRRHVLVSLRSR